MRFASRAGPPAVGGRAAFFVGGVVVVLVWEGRLFVVAVVGSPLFAAGGGRVWSPRFLFLGGGRGGVAVAGVFGGVVLWRFFLVYKVERGFPKVRRAGCRSTAG